MYLLLVRSPVALRPWRFFPPDRLFHILGLPNHWPPHYKVISSSFCVLGCIICPSPTLDIFVTRQYIIHKDCDMTFPLLFIFVFPSRRMISGILLSCALLDMVFCFLFCFLPLLLPPVHLEYPDLLNLFKWTGITHCGQRYRTFNIIYQIFQRSTLNGYKVFCWYTHALLSPSPSSVCAMSFLI